MSSKCFSALEIDAIGEILNISLGASATAVSTMLNARVDITTPVVNVIEKEDFSIDRIEPAVGVEITYISGLSGNNIMLLKRHDVKVIVEMLMGMEMSDEEFELNEMNISAVCEVMNQMMGASSTALSEFLGKMVNISTPISFPIDSDKEFIDKYFDSNAPKVVVVFTLKIADKLESEFFNVMPVELAQSLVEAFIPPEEIEKARAAERAEEEATAAAEGGSSDGGALSQEAIDAMTMGSDSSEGGTLSQEAIDAMTMGSDSSECGTLSQEAIDAMTMGSDSSDGGTLSQEAIDAMAMGASAPQMQQAQTAMPQMQQSVPQMQMDPSVSMMQMQMMQQMMQQMQNMQHELEEQKKAAEPKLINVQTASAPAVQPDKNIDVAGAQADNMDLIMGVPLELSVEIGRTKKLVKDILDFTKGSLVVLDRLAGEQVDLFVNGQCIAKGDVVVVEDNFGIRITEITKINLSTLQ